MSTDNRTIINGLDRAGDVLAEMAKREGKFSVHMHLNDRTGAVSFSCGTTLDKPGSSLGVYVYGQAETLPGAFLKFLADRAEKQAEVDAEAAQLAEFEAWKAAQAEQVAA